MIGITAFGAYIPRRRLQRKAIACHACCPTLSARKGERAMANWDEDAVTMAYEASRLPAGTDPATDRAHVDGVHFASTTLPHADRQNAGIVAAALGLGEGIASVDLHRARRHVASCRAGCRRAGRLNAPLWWRATGEDARLRLRNSHMAMPPRRSLSAGTVVAKFQGSHMLTLRFRRSLRGEGEELTMAGRALGPR
jgi:hypothetical protein